MLDLVTAEFGVQVAVLLCVNAEDGFNRESGVNPGQSCCRVEGGKPRYPLDP